jgi:hypothetical protein
MQSVILAMLALFCWLLDQMPNANPINEFDHLGLHKSRKKSHFICNWMGLMLFILCGSCVYAKLVL